MKNLFLLSADRVSKVYKLPVMAIGLFPFSDCLLYEQLSETKVVFAYFAPNQFCLDLSVKAVFEKAQTLL